MCTERSHHANLDWQYEGVGVCSINTVDAAVPRHAMACAFVPDMPKELAPDGSWLVGVDDTCESIVVPKLSCRSSFGLGWHSKRGGVGSLELAPLSM